MQYINLSVNENPFGSPPGAIEAIRRCREVNRYPEKGAKRLRRKLAERLAVDPRMLIFGNGCDGILQLVAQTLLREGDTALAPCPSFSTYGRAVFNRGASLDEVPLGRDFSFDAGPYLRPAKLVFLCSPNNPTGTVIPQGDIRRILESADYVVLDETYYSFSGEDNLDLLAEAKNLILCRSFSKDYGLAGLRLGYAVADKSIIREMDRVSLPYTVNRLAEAGGMEALKDEGFRERSVALIVEGRQYLSEGLKRLGFVVYPSGGNFVFVQVEDSIGVTESLKRTGILTKGYGRIEGFEKEYVRISVGTPSENERLVRAMEGLA